MARQPAPYRAKSSISAPLAQQFSGPTDFIAAFSVSRETADRLTIYAELLVRWQKTMNLVAPSTLGEIWQRHFADSAQLLARGPPDATNWVDLGSGAGFPGLVLAILRADGVASSDLSRRQKAILVESDSRKCAFLAEVVRKTDLSDLITVEIVNRRIENAETQASLGVVDVVTARALAPLDRLLTWSAPLFSEKTEGLYLKGRGAEAEIETARENWRFECQSWPSMTDPSAEVLRIRSVSSVRKGSEL